MNVCQLLSASFVPKDCGNGEKISGRTSRDRGGKLLSLFSIYRAPLIRSSSCGVRFDLFSLLLLVTVMLGWPSPALEGFTLT